MKPGHPNFRCRMPAEWEPHAATWMAWPHYRGDWPGKFEPVPWVYAEIIRHLGRHEKIELIVKDMGARNQARKVLAKANALNDNVQFHLWPTDRVWTRDSGCTFILCGAGALSPEDRKGYSFSRAADGSKKEASAPGSTLSAITWRFNAWSKYRNYRHDEKIGSRMAKAARAPEIRPVHDKSQVVLEGGSIDVNGLGTLLTTEECLLSKTQQRNPAMSRDDYEQVFSEYLGIKNVIWLGSGIAGDDTHGHVDDITRFVSPDTVVTAVESDPNDPNYDSLRENIRRLRAGTDQDGKPLAIIELPMPGAVTFEGRRLPASYANFYIAFPDREVVGIYSGDLIWGFGAMHCMAQQQPAI